jgi:hypothetical protein
MHPLVRDLYKRAITVGKDYPHPHGLDYVREVWKKALRDNKCFDTSDHSTSGDPIHYEKELRKAVGKGRYAIREMIAVIQFKKYRTLKKRYGATKNDPDNIDLNLDRIQEQYQDLFSKDRGPKHN